MSYRITSGWNKETELRSLLIFKKLEKDNFQRGEQIRYCRTMAAQTHLTPGSISAKVCNYKSVAGVNAPSKASSNTREPLIKPSDCDKILVHRRGGMSMTKQSGFSDLEYAQKKRLTRREKFLNEMELAVPWSELVALIAPHYPKAGAAAK